MCGLRWRRGNVGFAYASWQAMTTIVVTLTRNPECWYALMAHTVSGNEKPPSTHTAVNRDAGVLVYELHFWHLAGAGFNYCCYFCCHFWCLMPVVAARCCMPRFCFLKSHKSLGAHSCRCCRASGLLRHSPLLLFVRFFFSSSSSFVLVIFLSYF